MIRNECFTVSFCPKNRIEIQPLRGKNAEYYLAVLCTLRIVLNRNISNRVGSGSHRCPPTPPGILTYHGGFY